MIFVILNKLTEICSDLRALAIARIPGKAKWQILWVYCRLFFKSRFDRFYHFSEEHFLGYRFQTGVYHHFSIFFREIFVRHSYAFISSTDKPMIIDAGSNIGLSVLYFKWLYPQSKIIAFEPCPPLFEILKKNVEDNKLSDVTIIQSAVADKVGMIELYFPSSKPMGGAATIVSKAAETKREYLKSEWETVQVKTIALSEYISEPVELLKMDIEGAEGLSFQGLDQTKKLSEIQQGIIEFHYNEVSEKNSLVDLLTLLKRNHVRTTIYQERELSDPSGFTTHKRGFHNFMLHISQDAK